MKAIVVVFGNAGHGKDTLSDLIARHLTVRGSTMRLAFADPLKEAACALLGIPAHIAWGTAEVKEKETVYGHTVRHWLQWLGTEIGRNVIHQDVWVHRLGDTALDPEQHGMFAIVSDGRFENERTKLGPYVRERAPACRVFNVFIHRPGVPVKVHHPSESEVYAMGQRALAGEKLFDVLVENSGTIQDLDRAAAGIAEMILSL